MQETDKEKAVTVAAIAFDIQRRTIDSLTKALIISLIVCGISVITALYALSGRCSHEQHAQIIGVSAVAGAHIGRLHKTRFEAYKAEKAATA